MRKKDVSDKVGKATNKVVGTVVDLMLFSIYYGIEFGLAGYNARGWKADEKAFQTLSELNYQTIKRSIYHLKQKGLISTIKQKSKEESALLKITKEGEIRLKSIIPQYQKTRTWDGRVYLITYDLPIEKNSDRDKLREYIKKIGCGNLQKSVWITPYNPKRLIREFCNKNRLDNELILVSSLRKDGAVGSRSLPELLEQVYQLDDLNERYNDFVNSVKNGELKTKDQIIFSYLSILQDDPQIPFKLLPYNWKGDKAYKIFQKYSTKKN